jgi:membrane dipeptidase
MNCCGHFLTRRDWMWSTMLSSIGAMFAGCAGTRAAASDASLAAATTLLRDNISIDVHTHAGPNGLTSRTARPSDDLARGMRAGRIAVLCLADVPDGPILGRNANNVLVALRTPEPGFLYAYHLDRPADAAKIVGGNYLRIFAASGG